MTSRTLWTKLRSDDGTAAVSFILTFPIFLVIVAILCQLALIVNAKIMVTRAAEAAARSAATSLGEGLDDNVLTSAKMALVSISPKCPTSSEQGEAIADAYAAAGLTVPTSFASRFAYCDDAVAVEWTNQGADYTQLRGRPIEVTVRYKFYLTVPVAMGIAAPSLSEVAGISGRFITIESTVPVETSHGRKSYADGASQ